MSPAPVTIAILAGGSGTRFWPAGRAGLPKQFLALDGYDDRPLLRATVDRLAPLSPLPPRIVAPARLEPLLGRLVGDLPAECLLLEPEPRNTAAAVALAAATARAEGREGPLLVVPADHHVAPVGRYRAALRAMATRARRFDGLVTLGLRPARAATGYGYLRHGPATRRQASGSLHPVQRYVEKPDARVAARIWNDGRHAWSGGTFAFRPAVFLDALARHLPAVHEPLAHAMERHGRRGFGAALARAYEAMPAISVDYGVMEKTSPQEVYVGDFDWDDLGSWDAVARHRRPDRAGNRLRGPVTVVDSRDCVVDSDGGHVALLGVEDLVVVRTADAVLVARRGRGEDVRAVVERLRRAGHGDLVE